MPIADDQDVTGFDDLPLGIQLVHDLSFGAQADKDEVHTSGFRGHGGLVDTFCQQEVVVEIDRLTPCLGFVKVGFLNRMLYHVLIF